MTDLLARLSAICGGLIASLIMTCPANVMAQELVTSEDVVVLFQPEPARYIPDGDDLDLADQGKSFDVTCVITRSGRMSDCQAEENDIVDQNFVKIAVKTVSRWVVGPETRDGESSEGRVLIVTCQFRLEDQRDDQRIAAR